METNGSVFRKRYIERPGVFFRLFFRAMASLRKINKLGEEKKLSDSFAEKIILSVTGVNDCALCSQVHTELALSHGISEKEIQELLKGQIGDFPESEAIGLTYAQHLADSGGEASEKARERVVEQYGEDGTEEIETYFNVMQFANLAGNTLEAFRSKKVNRKRIGFLIVCLMIKTQMLFLRPPKKNSP